MIREYFKKVKSNELLVSSINMFILINIASFLSYLFQFFMARMLGPADYSVLAVLISLMYIFNVPSLSVQTVVSKNVTNLNAKKDFGKIKGLIKHFLKKMLLLSSFIFIIFIIFSFKLSSSLGVPLGLMALTGTTIILSFIYPVGIGTLQGLKKFNAFGWNNIFNSTIKLFSAIFLVYFGFRVYGAIIGFILAISISFLLTLLPIKEIVNSKEEKSEKIGIYSNGNIVTFFAMLIIVLMYSLDVIFAKVFFTSELTGGYAVLSLIGKIILFSTMSFGNVMFPISSERFLKKQKTSGMVKKIFFLVSLLCFSALLIFALFPEFIISLLFGDSYLGLSNILLYVGVAFTFISFLNIFILYKISKEEFNNKNLLALFLFLIIQIFMLIKFSNNIQEFSFAFMISTIISFLGTFLLSKKWKK
jgi:O-antigen/teichoic acid export membrane protein